MKRKFRVMNELFTSSVKKTGTKKMNLAYGLTILIDLADDFYNQGNDLNIISVKHGMPLAELEPIVVRLEKAELLERHPEDQNKLKLKGTPEGRWIFDIIPILTNALKGGQISLD